MHNLYIKNEQQHHWSSCTTKHSLAAAWCNQLLHYKHCGIKSQMWHSSELCPLAYHQFKFTRENWQREGLERYRKRFRKQHQTKAESSRMKHTRTEESVATVDELVLSQEDHTRTHTHTWFNMPDIQIASRGWFTAMLVWILFHLSKCSFVVSFSYIYISQGSVATQVRCGGIFNNYVTANFPQCNSERIFF